MGGREGLYMQRLPCWNMTFEGRLLLFHSRQRCILNICRSWVLFHYRGDLDDLSARHFQLDNGCSLGLSGNKASAHMEFPVWWRNPDSLAQRDLFSLGCALLQILGWKRILTATLTLCNSLLLVKFKLLVGNNGADDSQDWMKTGFHMGQQLQSVGSGCLECWQLGLALKRWLIFQLIWNSCHYYFFCCWLFSSRTPTLYYISSPPASEFCPTRNTQCFQLNQAFWEGKHPTN